MFIKQKEKITKHKKNQNQYYLDVAQYIITEPYQATPSPKVHPAPHEFNDVKQFFNNLVSELFLLSEIKTPHNLPFMIEFEGNQAASPYLKELLKNPEIQFYDFTLEGPQESDFAQDECKYLDDDVIMEQDEDENQKSDYDENLYDEPYIEPSRLNLKTFRAILEEFRNLQLTDSEVRQFVEEYLTEQDLEQAEGKTNQQLIEIAEYNLRPCGLISWLQRRNKVNKYLQKKKRRIWNKKINYDCRKKVAENRLRIKGKFVTQEQACQMLGLSETSSIDQIKNYLQRKYR